MKIMSSGIDSSVASLEKTIEAGGKAYRRAVRVEAEKVMTASQLEVPVDTGRLKNSKFIVIHETSNGLVAELGYSADYAIWVHEIPAAHAVGKWKYLEDPIKRAMGKFQSNVADAISKSMSRRSSSIGKGLG